MCDNAEKYFDNLKECKTAHFSLSVLWVFWDLLLGAMVILVVMVLLVD